jgi:uncharacterized protein
MKKIFIIALVLIVVQSGFAQITPGMEPAGQTPIGKQHKIVFQLTTDDTLAHKALMKQLNNITTVTPDTKIEVVCHGPGLNMLLKTKSVVGDKIIQLKKKDIVFVACEFSMSEKNISKDKMISEAGYVKYGILEIVTRQEEGWSYIKAGF